MAAAPAELQDAGSSSGWWPVLLHLVIYCAGAVGVIVLGVGYGRLFGAVASTTARLKSGEAPASAGASPLVVRAMARAMEDRLAEYGRTAQRLQNEVQDLGIRSQLAERERQQTEAILYSLRDAVIVVDGSDRLLVANGPAAQLFGFDREGRDTSP